MPRIPLDQLEPGMSVAEDVRNANGLLLLAQGAVLNEQSIRVLKTWGIRALKTTGGEAAGPERLPAQEEAAQWSEEAEKRLRPRFQHLSDDLRAVRLLRHLAVQRLARRLANSRLEPPP